MPFDPAESLAAARREFGEHGGVNLSIEASTTFTVMDAGVMPEIFEGRRGPEAGGCYLYGRHFNPTVYVLARYIAAIEAAESGYCTASGMSAIAGAIMQLCTPGDHVVSSNTIYGGTFALLHDFLPKRANISTSFVNIRDLAAVEAAITPDTRVLYCETVANPTMTVADIPALSKIARAHNLALVVDNTFTPCIVSPIQHGADIVVHSLTKFISGASDIIGGAVCASQEFILQLMDLHDGALMLLGPTMDPKIAHELAMRVPHLGIRMAEHSRRAHHFAQRLADLGLPVHYPGLPTHPDHLTLARIANPGYGFGGLFSLDLGTTERAFALMETLQNHEAFGFLAVSLGYFDTLMSCSASSTSSEMPEDALVDAGISPGLVRFSIGYTGSLNQRWSQFERALIAVGMI